ncbi:MAG TPA: hypothetical protein VFZ85_00335 [Jiangellaceae bacterium]
MTTTILNPRVTARAFLFDDGSGTNTATVIGREISKRGVANASFRGARRLSGSALEAVDKEIGTVTDGLLDMDLGDILVSGWRNYSELAQSAQRTLAAPGSEEIVVLARHRVSGAYHPRVDLLIDGVLLNSFEFELTIVFEVTGVSAVVRSGDLVALRGGECQVIATLSLEGAKLGTRKQTLDLGLLIQLQRPIPLVKKPTPFVPPQVAGADTDTALT